jgi:PIN domain nuclease of toxin-antitoxin system
LDSVRVFDSSAVLAVLFAEPGSDAVVGLLRNGLLSTVNLVEVHTRLMVQGASPDFAWNRIRNLGCELCSLDDLQARLAAEMIWQIRPFGLSLGDRACLALAIQRKATVYTTDSVWKNLSLGIQIEVIR